MKIIEKNNFGKIGVLMGGPSSEREISLKSGKAVWESLKKLNLDAVAIDIKTDSHQDNIALLKEQKIDCAFLALHGRFGEDGQIQEILDSAGIPYTGSGKLASQLAMDKISSRKVMEDNGVPVPAYRVIEKKAYQGVESLGDNLSFPLVIKPASHGSSIGLSIIDKKEEAEKAVDLAFQFDERILLEEYIEGREVTVGILDNQALPPVEIITKRRFFDYEAKYSAGLTEYVVPAKIEEALVKKVQAVALKTHKLLGCYAYSRVDIILNTQNIPFVLEVNTIPGFTKTSLFPKAALVCGIDFTQLCLKLLKLAYEKA